MLVLRLDNSDETREKVAEVLSSAKTNSCVPGCAHAKIRDVMASRKNVAPASDGRRKLRKEGLNLFASFIRLLELRTSTLSRLFILFTNFFSTRYIRSYSFISAKKS